ncbi:MAG: DUF433 domain-containing protein [Chloroflexi bacterium]|nr:DUF433 domain-containing protein [Chloroflexota bacterium]
MAIHEETFEGIYGVPEAAKLIQITHPLANGHTIPRTRLQYWINTSVARLRPADFPGQQNCISFRSLISMRLISILRAQGVSLEAIRTSESWLRGVAGIDWPFISKPLWTYSSELFTEFQDKLVVASNHGQQAMDFIREWLEKIDVDLLFDQEDLAYAWLPQEDVRIDPKIQLGKPCLAGTRIPTSTIWNKADAGDSVDVIAGLYGLSIDHVNHALAWERRLVAADS